MGHPYLSFGNSVYPPYKVVGTSESSSAGNGLTDSSISEVVIPEKYEEIKVVEIGYRSFYGKTSIVSVFIPKTIRHIRFEAFFGCTKLSVVKFAPDSELRQIEKDTFQNDNSIVKIDIPPSVEMLGYASNQYVFYGITSLTCFSYLGSTDFSTSKVFHNTPEIHVSNTLYPKGSKFGQKDVIRDGKSCGVSNFVSLKALNCRHSILIRDHYTDLSKLSLLIMVSF